MIWYMASCYTNYPNGLDEAFEVATKAAAEFFRQGTYVFAPIVHCHPMQEVEPELGNDWDTWMGFDHLMMDRCDGCIVVKMPGWETSKGITAEIKYFKGQGKPIKYVTPEDLSFE